MSRMRFILFTLLLVISLQSRLYSSSFVYGIVNGSLNDSWRMNLTIFAPEFRGVILDVIDSEYNYFRILHYGDNDVGLKFNDEYKRVSLSTLCGCTPCNNHSMVLHIESGKSAVNITCNNHPSQSIRQVSRIGPGYSRYRMPMFMANVRDSMYVMIGNYGPSINVDNKTVHPWHYQVIGCVDSFYYNDILVPLSSVGDKVKTWCPTCSKYPCNGGVCRQLSRDNVTCDCSNVALNGRYCNNTLRNYDRGRDTSLNMKKYATGMYVKMTWRTLISRRYCLVEIFHESVEYNNYLLLDSSSLNNDNNLLANFIIINITNTYSYIRTNNVTRKIDFIFSKHMRINIGFSERRNSCVEFEGAYDIFYENLRIIPGGTTSTSPDNSRSSNHNLMTSTSPDNSRNFPILVSVSTITVAIIVFLLFVVVIMYRRMKSTVVNVTKDIVAIELPERDSISC